MITHTTDKGTSEFGLTNTNKLVRQYEYATGLKTGSTGEAKFCVSATSRKKRNRADCRGYGCGELKGPFLRCSEAAELRIRKMPALYGRFFRRDSARAGGKRVEEQVENERAGTFTYLDVNGANLNSIERSVEYNEAVPAPVQKGDVVGRIVYTLDGSEIGATDLIASESVEKASFFDYLKDALEAAFL